MTDNADSTLKTPPPIWDYVSTSEFSAPSPPITSAVRVGIAGLWQRLTSGRNAQADPLKKEEQLKDLSATVLGCVASSPDWRNAAIALKTKLSDWIGAEPESMPAVVVIGQPHSGNQDILHALAADQNWRILSPPTAEQILSQAPKWLNQAQDNSTPWVLPNLEKCYLRHPGGLNMVRNFLAQLRTGSLGRGIIGCDSWAWAYLKHIVRGGLPDALVAQAFDQERLSLWLRTLAAGSEMQQIEFRQTNNGGHVLPSFPKNVSEDADSEATTNFVANLAAFARGIPGVALSAWRQALRSEPDDVLREQDAGDARCALQSTIWVLPWEQIKHPVLNSDIGVDSTMVLHNLLLHDGLPADVLADITPVSPNSILQTIHLLENAGIIAEHENRWRITASSYPIVRQYLDGEGYLTDLL